MPAPFGDKASIGLVIEKSQPVLRPLVPSRQRAQRVSKGDIVLPE